MKTVKEWLEELPDGYRERALRNMDKPNSIQPSIGGALGAAFFWDEYEGANFWYQVALWVAGKGELPPLPIEAGYFRISERTPENGEAAIVRGNQFVAIGWWDDPASEWLDNSLDSWDAKPLKGDITHWMYVPELPEVNRVD